MGSFDRLPELRHELVEVAGTLREVEPARVDHQHRRPPVVVVEVVVGVDQLHQVVPRDVALVGALAAADAGEAGVDVGLQVDHEVRRRHLRLEHGEELVVDQELVVGEVQVGEDPVLVEGVVGDHQALEKLALDDLLLLLEARQQEVELGLEGGARAVLVELVEERVLDVLEHLDPLEAAGQELDQRGLADPDGAVDRQVVVGQRIGAQGEASVERRRPGSGPERSGPPRSGPPRAGLGLRREYIPRRSGRQAAGPVVGSQSRARLSTRPGGSRPPPRAFRGR